MRDVLPTAFTIYVSPVLWLRGLEPYQSSSDTTGNATMGIFTSILCRFQIVLQLRSLRMDGQAHNNEVLVFMGWAESFMCLARVMSLFPLRRCVLWVPAESISPLFINPPPHLQIPTCHPCPTK
jgi:hypothetical protein